MLNFQTTLIPYGFLSLNSKTLIFHSKINYTWLWKVSDLSIIVSLNFPCIPKTMNRKFIKKPLKHGKVTPCAFTLGFEESCSSCLLTKRRLKCWAVSNPGSGQSHLCALFYISKTISDLAIISFPQQKRRAAKMLTENSCWFV